MSNTIIGVRVQPEDRELLDKVCRARGEGISDFVRRAIRKELAELSFYPDEIKKALGMKKRVHSITEPMFFRSTYLNLEEIADRLVALDARCTMCNTPFTKKDIGSYDHPNGITLKGYDKPQWIYMTCQKCLHQSALWKILNRLRQQHTGTL